MGRFRIFSPMGWVVVSLDTSTPYPSMYPEACVEGFRGSALCNKYFAMDSPLWMMACRGGCS